MAWLTNSAVLGALAQVSQVQIVVQKEDFLRPDAGGPRNDHLRRMYGKLKGVDRQWFSHATAALSWHMDPDSEAVRCMGVAAQDRSANNMRPLMHHKFLVRLVNGDCGTPHPNAVWTGSFNATKNGTRSLENALIIPDKAVAMAYFEEWAWILGQSESLDWNHEWICPDYRIGS